MGSNFPSGCAVNANGKEDTFTIRQNQKTPGEFPHCRGMGGRQLVSALQLLSPGDACAPGLSPLGESFLQSIRGQRFRVQLVSSSLASRSPRLKRRS